MTCPGLLPGKLAAGSRTRDQLIASPSH